MCLGVVRNYWPKAVFNKVQGVAVQNIIIKDGGHLGKADEDLWIGDLDPIG